MTPGTNPLTKWAQSKPHAGLVQGEGVTLNFYVTRPGFLIHACPRCRHWYEVRSWNVNELENLECPEERCAVQYTVKGGKFQWRSKPTSTPRS